MCLRLEEIFMRIILYTGKGGVGKTSIAAATACKIAQEGKKVLIMSTDQAHSLRDAFQRKLGIEPTQVAKNLEAVELDAVTENEKVWGKTKKYFKKLLLLKAEKDLASEELLVFPGFEELLALMKIREIEKEGKYDVLIVDCAPTGETLSLMKFPEMIKWWMAKVFPIKKKASRIAKPIVERTVKIPMPDDETFDEIENMYLKLEELHELLLDKEKTSLRIVTTPEKIVIQEAKRNFSYLHLYNFNVDAVVVNKIFPEEGIKGYFNKWAEIQKKSLKEITESFKPVPVFKAMLLQQELTSVKALQKMGESVFAGVDPSKIMWKDKIFEIEKSDEGYYFRINMPFVDKKEMDLIQKGDEITITIKNEKRSFILPKKLHGKEISKAAYREKYLELVF
jgi:arsenite-transporting ATPase